MRGNSNNLQFGLDPFKSTPGSTNHASHIKPATEKTPWKRDGKFKFTFEAKSLDRRMTFKQMEATDHSFSDTARNWGYQNFWKRSDAWFNNRSSSYHLARAKTDLYCSDRSSQRESITTSSNRIGGELVTVDADLFHARQDAFLLICTIIYSPTPPSPPPPLSRLLIPKDLVRAFGSLFDDATYSDVVFRIRPSGELRDGTTPRERRLFASKKILKGRCDYFETSESSLSSPCYKTDQ